MTDRPEIETRVKKVLAEQLAVDEAQVVPDARFAEDLKSSYGVMTFLEKPFKIGDVLSSVDRALAGRMSEVAPGEDEELSREASDSLENGIAAYKSGDLDRAISFLLRARRSVRAPTS